MNDIKIKNINSIIATEVLLKTYKINVLKYTSEEVEKLIKLLEVVKPSLPKLIKKAKKNESNI